MDELQATLIRELHCGILEDSPSAFRNRQDDDDTCLPAEWARASILIRINSLASGSSGVRVSLVENMIGLLANNITPRIPLRGSISASGDLMPLAYIAGTLEGKSTLKVWTGKPHNHVMTAKVALAEASISPISLGPKEGLAIVNGTAVSTGVAVLAVHDANNLIAMSQILTAMSVEALCGTEESFDAFFSKVRPHPGQTEVASNLRGFLDGSKLTQPNHGLGVGNLRQDRYATRTAPQWLGPVLEDLVLATAQVTIESNSVTDNPLIDAGCTPGGQPRVLHGGNFQAKTITSAMEKIRQALQSVGQMLFAQCTEILNPKLNYGLPPSLAVDEPSKSYLLKPIDIMVASLQSELGFLANPAGTHVQAAEMGNQQLNSLGLISARYTHTALDVLAQMAAAHLFVLCQALDLRALNRKFLEAFKPRFEQHTSQTMSRAEAPKSVAKEEPDTSCFCQRDAGTTSKILGSSTIPVVTSQDYSPELFTEDAELPLNGHTGGLYQALWNEFEKQLDQTSTLDSSQRFGTIFRSLQPIVIDHTANNLTAGMVQQWTMTCADCAREVFLSTRDAYFQNADAKPYLGKASRRMYQYIRDTLGIPFLHTALLLGQSKADNISEINKDIVVNGEGSHESTAFTTGDLLTRIYESIMSGDLYAPVMECLAEVWWKEKQAA